MAKEGVHQDSKAEALANDPARLPETSESLAINPLLTHPAAAMAAATAIGFGLTTQFASVFFGALQGALEVANRLGKTGDREGGAANVAPADVAARSKTASETAVAAQPTDTSKTKAVSEPRVAEPKIVARPEKAPAAVKPKRVPKAKVAAKPVEVVPAPVRTAAPVKPVAEKPASAPKQRVPRKRTAETASAAGPDDLKRISGIGPKLEKVLNDMGVTRFAEIAGWSETDIARFDKELGFEGRIGRDDWIGQAKKLQ